MNFEVINGVAVLRTDEVLLTDTQSALDLLATVTYETGCSAMVLPKAAVSAEFWKLATGLAGEILQKYTNYHMRLGVVGDFAELAKQSKPLHDFLYESNQGRDFFFVPTEEEALRRLSASIK